MSGLQLSESVEPGAIIKQGRRNETLLNVTERITFGKKW